MMPGIRIALATLAFPMIALAKPGMGAVASDASPASTAFALAHLGLIIGMCAAVAVFGWVIYRRSKAPNFEREFLEDMHEEEQQKKDEADRSKRKANGSTQGEEPLEPWEKPADWWQR
jgi:hypothetical protein